MLTIHALLDVLKLVNCVLVLVCTIGLVDFLHLILQRRKQQKLYCYRHATHTCDKHGPSTYYAVSSIEEHTFEQQDIYIRHSAKAMLSVERFSDFFCYFFEWKVQCSARAWRSTRLI